MFVTLPNVIWSLRLSSSEIDRIQFALRGSVKATIGGIFFTLIYSSSIYHLLLLSLQRFAAIRWPIWYKTKGMQHMPLMIAIVWATAILAASVPTWFPDSFVFAYSASVFLFVPAFDSLDALFTSGLQVISGFFLLPYLMMSALTVATGLIVRNTMERSRKLSGFHHKKTSFNKETRVLITLTCMEIGFTVTLLPNTIVVLMFYFGQLDCDSFSIPYLISFYLSTLNSLVNVAIYSFRDETFRKNILKVFENLFSCCKKKKKDFQEFGETPAQSPPTPRVSLSTLISISFLFDKSKQ
ncbi:unnamed protein product [Clavelina lepadiformis]|uniref:G-protein coupled receptors family 1 profile domain-containing protein n=1 Tax=Clavelina lepadiformis TaxID=159417 RepID=A0ABP0GSR5_CLALP